MENEKKIFHDYICQVCGKPAEINYQLVWCEYPIDEYGEFGETEFGNVDENEFFCSECFEKEMKIVKEVY